MESITYKVKVYCENCDLRAEVDIEKGKVVDETKCPNCGNLTLVKDQDVVTTSYYDFDV